MNRRALIAAAIGIVVIVAGITGPIIANSRQNEKAAGNAKCARLWAQAQAEAHRYVAPMDRAVRDLYYPKLAADDLASLAAQQGIECVLR